MAKPNPNTPTPTPALTLTPRPNPNPTLTLTQTLTPTLPLAPSLSQTLITIPTKVTDFMAKAEAEAGARAAGAAAAEEEMQRLLREQRSSAARVHRPARRPARGRRPAEKLLIHQDNRDASGRSLRRGTGCLGGTGSRKVLAFSTRVHNIGCAPFVVAPRGQLPARRGCGYTVHTGPRV